MKKALIILFVVLIGCSPSSENYKSTNKEFSDFSRRLEKQTSVFIYNSIGVWKARDSVNYALIDSADLHLFKVIYPDYVITDTVNVKQFDGETFIYHANPIGKECYKINVLDQLVYYDDLGKPFQTYQPIK